MIATALGYPRKFTLFSNILSLGTGEMIKTEGDQERQGMMKGNVCQPSNLPYEETEWWVPAAKDFFSFSRKQTRVSRQMFFSAEKPL